MRVELSQKHSPTDAASKETKLTMERLLYPHKPFWTLGYTRYNF